MNKTMIISAGAILGTGVALGAYQTGLMTPHADVVASTPVTAKEPVYADVVKSSPVTGLVTTDEKVCRDHTIVKRTPERFGTKDGTIIGAVTGGLLGNMIGGGRGRVLTTVGGAVAGGYIGHEIDEHHHGGRRYTATESVCRNEPKTESRIIGYDVQFRSGDGQILTRREQDDPGQRIWIGDKDVVIGYDVTWRYHDQTGSVRLDHDPGKRLPWRDGTIVTTQQGLLPSTKG